MKLHQNGWRKVGVLTGSSPSDIQEDYQAAHRIEALINAKRGTNKECGLRFDSLFIPQ